ncbi:bacteriocin-protection protein, YdeI/OmpD-associated family [Leptospira broomii serovar Hurstbridge str. 5399]|uniref:Bacteriocin-protection protein, YdeI/OmpD-associated family n=1 Tax=Leptospira broomii serovar Hurstbridge str. 5399 TaxID=1049789 RepID=T0F8A8_9LEPT|nr:YdeI/OmpD-associated family protein [Leptospira broomii]EQA44136.1 bacteriocin-protection protein, YdeI/OmpD-associated family [Leptospira broomii serovar Hurstbridge str. 5399]
MSGETKEIPTIAFRSQKEWEKWLKGNHSAMAGVWLKFAKKKSGIETVTYEEAIEIALCYGWIDSHKKPFDTLHWIQKFSPRGARSIWSKINRDKAEKLIASGKMKSAGLKAIENARQNGSWEKAYDSPGRISVPEDLKLALEKNKKAKAFFETLDSTNRYAILFRIHNAKKEETRIKRLRRFVEMLERNEKIHNKKS